MENSKKGKSVILFAGFFILILLVIIAGWLTVHMLDLSQSLDQIAGTGIPETTKPQAPVHPKPNVVTQKMPVPPPPAPVLVQDDTQTASPSTENTGSEIASATDREPMGSAPETDEKKPEEPQKIEDAKPADTIPPQIRHAQDEGQIPSLVEGENETTAGSVEPIAEKPGQFSIQVGAFRVKKNAIERASIIKSLGFSPYIFSMEDAKGRTWYTVRMGKFDALEKAKEMMSSFRQKSDFPAVIMHANSLLPALTN